ncbi:hypothetical protein U1Q18_049994, partial [Sarracenia purpurea var. burkii]
MTTDSMYVDLDAAFRGADSRYHKKRPHRKPKNLCPSMADDCGTTEDEEEGIIITDDDVISPHKSTAQLITLVGTDGVAPRRPKGLTVPSANLMKNNTDLASRPLLPKNDDVSVVPSADQATSRCRMKNDLKRKLHKLERKLSRIKRDEVIEKIAAVKQDPPTPPQVKTPPHITGQLDDDDDDPNGDQPASPKSGSIRTRRVNAKMPTVQPEKKKRRKRKPKKQKANLREFKQEIPIEGMNYVMEVVLEQQLIENTRVGNIDFRKDPKFAVKTTKTPILGMNSRPIAVNAR